MITYKIEHKKGLLNALDDCKEHGVNSMLVLCSSKSTHDFQRIFFPILKASNITFLGGIFPSLIYHSTSLDEGVILIAFNQIIDHRLLRLDLSEDELDSNITQFKAKTSTFTTQSLLLFVSAFGADKSIFLKSVFNNYGNQVNYFGAGCGDLSFNDIKCIITPEGIHENAGLVISFSTPAEMNFSHGWQAYSESYKVTQVDANEVISINWRPAFEVYQEALFKLAGETIDASNFHQVVKSFPFGILRMDSALIVRDPFHFTERGGLMIVDKIEEGEFIRIMHGDSKSLIHASMELNKSSSTQEDSALLCFNCISRKLFHGSNINEELKSVSTSSLVGAFTIGEIINEGKSYLEMFNKIIATVKI